MSGIIRRGFATFARSVIPLEPGLVHIQNFLSLKEQIALTHLALEEGKKEGRGFWTVDQELNCTENRGRIFDAINTFPEDFFSTSMDALKLAKGVDDTLSSPDPTHMILLYYESIGEAPHIPWHQDNGENDGEGTHPVVSISLGDTCEFPLCHTKPQTSANHPLSNPKNLAHRVTLRSGDALIFGGDCRYLWHSIYTIYLQSAPEELPIQGARLNFTFRHAPEILGKEASFKTIDPNIENDNQFFKLSEMK